MRKLLKSKAFVVGPESIEQLLEREELTTLQPCLRPEICIRIRVDRMTTNLVTAQENDDVQIVSGEMLERSRLYRLVC